MKKKTTTKKKPAARPIPPPPPGWEIVGKDDPRLDCLPCIPLAFDPSGSRDTWDRSKFSALEKVPEVVRNVLIYALPVAQPAPASPPMIRLRLPSEKPTMEDGDKDGYVLVFWDNGQTTLRLWSIRFESAIIAWLPGRLPEGILPREPSQEEKWRAEFEAKFTDCNLWKQPDGKYAYPITKAAWRGFLAAKEGGAK